MNSYSFHFDHGKSGNISQKWSNILKVFNDFAQLEKLKNFWEMILKFRMMAFMKNQFGIFEYLPNSLGWNSLFSWILFDLFTWNGECIGNEWCISVCHRAILKNCWVLWSPFRAYFCPQWFGIPTIKNRIKRLFIQCSTNNSKLDRDDRDMKGKGFF